MRRGPGESVVHGFRTSSLRHCIAIGGFHQRRRSPNYINWVYVGQVIVKSTQFGQNWMIFFRKRYTDGWKIGQKIGIEKVRF